MEDKVIGEIEKNKGEVFRVTVQEFKGSRFVDLRVYHRDRDGELRPTTKGVAIAPGKIDEVVNLLNASKVEFLGDK